MRRIGSLASKSARRFKRCECGNLELHESLTPVERRRRMLTTLSTTKDLEEGDSAENAPLVSFHKTEIPLGFNDPKLQALLKLPVGDLGTSGYASKFGKRAIVMLCQKYNTYEAIDKADRLLQRLWDEGIQLDVPTCNLILRGWIRAASAGSHDESTAHVDDPVFRARRILEEMLHRHTQNPDLVEGPNDQTYSALLAVCAASSHPDARHLADSAVRELEDRLQASYKATPHASGARSKAYPASSIYNSIIRVHTMHADQQYGAATAAEDWLMHLTQLATNPGGPQPTVKAFNIVLHAWSICPEENGAHRALELLDMTIQLATKHGVVHPDGTTFGTVAAAFARRNAPHDAEEVFRRALKYFATKEPRRKWDGSVDRIDLTSCLNSCINAWSKSGLPEAAQMADNLLLDGYALNPENSTFRAHVASAEHAVQVVPDLVTHTSYIYAQIRSGHQHHAHQHLVDMVEEASQGDTPFPNTKLFDTVIHGWFRGSMKKEESDGDRKSSRGHNVSALVDLMIENSDLHGKQCAPRDGTLTMCIQVLCDENCADEAVRMLEIARNRKLDKFHAYASVVNMLTRKEAKPEEIRQALGFLSEDLEAKLQSGEVPWSSKVRGLYTSAFAAAARFRNEASADIVLNIIRKVHSRNDDFTSRAYTSAIRLFGKLGNEKAGRDVTVLFDKLAELHPDENSKFRFDHVLFQTVLIALKNTRKPNYAAKTCDILSHMMRLWRDEFEQGSPENLEPTQVCYDACLEALVLHPRHKANVHRAHQLLFMIQSNIEQGTLSHAPSGKVRTRVETVAEKAGLIGNKRGADASESQ